MSQQAETEKQCQRQAPVEVAGVAQRSTASKDVGSVRVEEAAEEVTLEETATAETMAETVEEPAEQGHLQDVQDVAEERTEALLGAKQANNQEIAGEKKQKPRPQEAPPQASSAAPVVAGQGTRFQLPPSYAVQCLSSRTQSLQDVEELRGILQAALIAAISELVWPGALEGESLRL